MFSYTEASKVQKVLNELVEKNQQKYVKVREDKIFTQVVHL